MKQYLNSEQTAKLIELGFEKPKSEVECDLPKGDWRIGAVGIRRAYSIGELIEMLLPRRAYCNDGCERRRACIYLYPYTKGSTNTFGG